MYENEDIQGYIADSAIVLAKEKDETQPQFASHAKIVFCFVLLEEIIPYLEKMENMEIMMLPLLTLIKFYF